ncbi:MAG: 4a-hydroxytetrahydrobiopterin dehydratase [Pseudonocardiales bacterium]|jgi:4a-hydroxytetrahydrobiopterin dehydratase|nr:4a-hydroxytetrahydrobiopterin dehydratase [Pseudonocardiales bacterium]
MTTALTRPAAAAGIDGLGWSYILGTFLTYVPVTSHAKALEVAGIALAAAAPDSDDHVALALRPNRVELTLTDRDIGQVTARDIELAAGISTALAERGFMTKALPDGQPRGVQLVEFAIDALDIAAIRPFWKAVLGYVSEPGLDGPTGALVDPQRLGPPLWFQQMDEPRPQRNRIHFDLTVPHEEAEARIAAALAAGGTLVTDEYARSFWVLADREGNEICVCTWQDRD